MRISMYIAVTAGSVLLFSHLIKDSICNNTSNEKCLCLCENLEDYNVSSGAPISRKHVNGTSPWLIFLAVVVGIFTLLCVCCKSYEELPTDSMMHQIRTINPREGNLEENVAKRTDILCPSEEEMMKAFDTIRRGLRSVGNVPDEVFDSLSSSEHFYRQISYERAQTRIFHPS